MRREQVVMGIDGGGSNVRAAVVAPDLAVLGQSQGPTANPSVIGADAAAKTIQAVMREALDAAGLAVEHIAAVGIGVAGAATHHSAGWLRQVVAAVTPQAHMVPSTDYEIALVGALGERQGVLVLAGTGSLAYGVNTVGETALVGGWGYLLGDEGSGYWLGIEGLRAVAQASDGRGPPTSLTRTLLGTLGLQNGLDLVPWLYQAKSSRIRDVARLAPLVLRQAAAGDAVAEQIVLRACDALVLAAQTVIHRLGMDAPAIAFAGGLLSAVNPLSSALCAALGLETLPVPRYPPVIGAALLAWLTIEGMDS